MLNVASTAGFAPVPYLGTYAASKSYMISWTHSLATELKGTRVRACVLCPGSTATNFHAVAGAVGRRPHTGPQQSAADVAEECLRGVDRGKRVIVTGLVNRMHAGVFRLLPQAWAAWLGAAFNKPRHERRNTPAKSAV